MNRISKKINPIIRLVVFLACISFTPDFADARPGGGHSSRSGGGSFRSSGGGSYRGGGGGGQNAGLESVIAFAFVIGFIGICYLISAINKLEETSGHINIEVPRDVSETALAQLKKNDPDFSISHFLDFNYALWNEIILRSGNQTLKMLTPWVTQEVIEFLQKKLGEGKTENKEIITGTIKIQGFKIENSDNQTIFRIVVSFKSNFTGVDINRNETRFVVSGLLNFFRDSNAQTVVNHKFEVLSCPSCGGSLIGEQIVEKCNWCGSVTGASDANWKLDGAYIQIFNIGLPAMEPRYSEFFESGYKALPVIETDIGQKLEKLIEEGFVPSEFRAVFETTFEKIYSLWSRNELAGMEMYITERLVSSFGMWIDTYKRNNLINRLDQWALRSYNICRIETDNNFDSVTVHFKASCLDWTVNTDTGEIVDGSSRALRYFAEYWTFVRRRNPMESSFCPSCSAPVSTENPISCASCGSRLTVPENTWKLSIIEQA